MCLTRPFYILGFVHVRVCMLCACARARRIPPYNVRANSQRIICLQIETYIDTGPFSIENFPICRLFAISVACNVYHADTTIYISISVNSLNGGPKQNPAHYTRFLCRSKINTMFPGNWRGMCKHVRIQLCHAIN